MAVHTEYRLWYVMPDVIVFALELDVRIFFALASRANVCKCHELFEIIESTRSDQLPSSWREGTNGPVDYHPGSIGAVGDSVSYDAWLCRPFDEAAARSWAATLRIVPNDVNVGWVHDEDDTPSVSHYTSCDFVPK